MGYIAFTGKLKITSISFFFKYNIKHIQIIQYDSFPENDIYL